MSHELTAQVFAALSGNPAPDPSTIVEMLDEQQRTVLRMRCVLADQGPSLIAAG